MADLGARYDPEADALYVTIRDGRVVTTMAVSDGVNVDLDEDHNVIGVEVLDVTRKPLPPAPCGCPVGWLSTALSAVRHTVECSTASSVNRRIPWEGLEGIRRQYAEVQTAIADLRARFPMRDEDWVRAVVMPDGPNGRHLYVATGHLHGHDDHCRSGTSLGGGPKEPNRCKWCEARCLVEDGEPM